MSLQSKRDRIDELRKHIEEAEQQARLFKGRRKRAKTVLHWIKNMFCEVCHKWEATDLKVVLRRLDEKQ